MLLPVTLHLILTVCLSIQTPASSPPAGCQDWQECRQQALDAVARHEYERFHDLAWRTVQTGPPRRPELLFLPAPAPGRRRRPARARAVVPPGACPEPERPPARRARHARPAGGRRVHDDRRDEPG